VIADIAAPVAALLGVIVGAAIVLIHVWLHG